MLKYERREADLRAEIEVKFHHKGRRAWMSQITEEDGLTKIQRPVFVLSLRAQVFSYHILAGRALSLPSMVSLLLNSEAEKNFCSSFLKLSGRFGRSGRDAVLCFAYVLVSES